MLIMLAGCIATPRAWDSALGIEPRIHEVSKDEPLAPAQPRVVEVQQQDVPAPMLSNEQRAKISVSSCTPENPVKKYIRKNTKPKKPKKKIIC